MKKTYALTPENGYWDSKTQALSSFLWLPTEQALHELPESSGRFDGLDMLMSSWFKSQVYSLPFTLHAGSEQASTSDDTLLRSRKIRIYPDAGQKEQLSLWLEAARHIYNMTLEHLRAGNKPDWLTAKRELLKDFPSWTAEVPYQVKVISVRDGCFAFRNASREGRKIRLKSRHDTKQSIFIPKTSVNRKGIYSRILGIMKCSEDIPVPECDCRVVREMDRWFVCVPVRVAHSPEKSRRMVSLDPGIRSFMTFYSADSCGKIGKGAFTRIYSLCRYLDELNAEIAAMNHDRRYRAKKAMNRLRWKIVDLTEEMIHKTALFLVRNFDVIALPELRRDFADKITSRSAREMLKLTHSDFQAYLRAKAEQAGKKVIAQDEEYTSSVCSWSGEISRAEGRYIGDGAVSVDRDYNGARGIFLRAMRESAVSSPV